MLSKNLIKTIKSLELKKFRNRDQLFVAEGPKVVEELMKKMSPTILIATDDWWQAQGLRAGATADGTSGPDLQTGPARDGATWLCVSEEELRKVSFMQHPQQVVAVFPLPVSAPLPSLASNELCIALDGVQDPGNVGTIVRIADWFGIHTVVCSADCADAFAPKVVQATMGSLARVSVCYTDLSRFLADLPPQTPVYGTLLDGDDLYAQPLQSRGVIIFGNEGNGISLPIRPLVTHRLLIPSYPRHASTAESLNVATAAAIVCAEFRRQSSAL